MVYATENEQCDLGDSVMLLGFRFVYWRAKLSS